MCGMSINRDVSMLLCGDVKKMYYFCTLIFNGVK